MENEKEKKTQKVDSDKKSEKESKPGFSPNKLFVGMLVVTVLLFFVFAFSFLTSQPLTGLAVLPAENPDSENALDIFPNIIDSAKIGEDEVAAIVNGEKIFLSELEKRLKTVPEEFAAMISKESILENMVDSILLLQEAQKNNITVDGDEVDQVFSAQQEAVQEIIELGDFSEEEVRKSIKESLVVQKYLDEVFFPSIEVSNEEAAEFFEQNGELLKQVSASHILVETEEKAQELLVQLEGGADFAELAKEHSTDTGSGQNGGELGFFRKGDMVEEFGEVAFSLNEGERSNIVKTDFGYHIILVHEIKDDFESLFSEIEQTLRQKKMDTGYTDLLKELKESAEIETFLEAEN